MSIKIDGLRKEFNDTVALNNVSIDIKDNEFIAILGPSGCGKTTLLRLIGGFIEPTEGKIICNNLLYSSKDFNLPVENRNLGMVFQSFALWPHMTIKNHILFPLQSKKFKCLSNEEKEKRALSALKATGLELLENRLPGELSGGQKQRVSLARAIVGRPSILLMDEPLSALDAELRVSMRKEIMDIHNTTNSTIIYVTHDQGEALAMADRIIIMKDGNIEQIGSPSEIYLKPQTEFVAKFVSKCNILKGTWINNKFYVDGENFYYTGNNISRYFKENGTYPVRPEEFTFDSSGLYGEIINKQYQGREIHYTVRVKNENYTVYSSNINEYPLGYKVHLNKK